MADELLTVPALRLSVSDELFRAVGHVALQWAFVENHIDSEILRLNELCSTPVDMRGKFDERADGWLKAACEAYAGHQDLIDRVADLTARAKAIKPERDRLLHGHLGPPGVLFRFRKGKVVDVLEIGTAPQIEDLACRISEIGRDLAYHLTIAAHFRKSGP